MTDDELLAALVEDPDALDAADWERALALASADPARLRRHLRLDELLGRALDPGRADLHAAIRHRIEHPVQSGRFVAKVARSAALGRRGRPRENRRSTIIFSSLAALAALVALIVGIWTWEPSASVRTLSAAEPAAIATLRAGSLETRRDGVALAIAAGSRLVAGEAMVVGAHGAAIAYADGTTLALVPGSRLSFAADTSDRGLLAELASGAIEADVTPQAVDRPLVLVTPEAEVTVLGTRFSLACGDGRTRLSVSEGRVRLTRREDGAALEVAAGQTIVAAPGVALRVAPEVERVLLVRDFEDDALPRGTIGSIAVAPARAGSQRCLSAADDGQPPVARARVADEDDGLFVYQAGAELSFAYWTDDRGGALSVYVWNRTRQTSMGGFELYPPQLERGRWARATVDLATLGAAGEQLREGDLVSEITIQTGLGPATLLIDDVRVVARPPP